MILILVRKPFLNFQLSRGFLDLFNIRVQLCMITSFSKISKNLIFFFSFYRKIHIKNLILVIIFQILFSLSPSMIGFESFFANSNNINLGLDVMAVINQRAPSAKRTGLRPNGCKQRSWVPTQRRASTTICARRRRTQAMSIYEWYFLVINMLR